LDPKAEFVGEVFLKCNAREVVNMCWTRASALEREAYGSSCDIPDIRIAGHLDATFPYILSHLQYVIGELLRNSIQAVVERGSSLAGSLPPIEVLICEAPQHVIIRISDQGGGIPQEIMSDLWSFSKSSQSETRLKNLSLVPKMAATMQELRLSESGSDPLKGTDNSKLRSSDGSLSSLTSRPPNLRLGMGLPMSRVYAEYVWQASWKHSRHWLIINSDTGQAV
jgi:pyruvate dehydrogenase kinase 2/3/4